ncbi:hypothetical protein INT47_003206 [Mucor saturninus]|uniref:BZIP domain-containing protein n=1 Tax=Mucor saturninus TaxID=64648 RepID=A0A8H7RFI4_9FUNG|nr:hypothetical protein INT47_003206 [Mucor saturninus]
MNPATDWNFNTPAVNAFNSYINEINPYDNHPSILNQKTLDIDMLPRNPQYESQLESPHTPPPTDTPPKKQRRKLLEKNREAAYRCRQKKKKWVNDLEERSESVEHKNRELQEQVARLRDESIYLRNLLLTHGNCDCDVVQTYLRRTSEQLTNSCQMPALGGSGSSVSGSESSYNSSKQFYNSSPPTIRPNYMA